MARADEPDEERSHGDLPRLKTVSRLRSSLPSTALLLTGGLCWSVTMVASMLFYQWRTLNFNNFHIPALMVIFLSGGFVGWLLAIPLARFLIWGRALETRFAGFFLILSVSTVGLTALFFAFQYRLFYAQWHQDFGLVGWLLAAAVTGIGAVYQFLVLGLPQYLPIAFPALVLTSHWLARDVR